MNTNKKVCGCCQTAKAPAQFHKSPLSSGQFLPICKLCCKDKLKTYTEITGSESAAFWLVLSELGVPFIKEVWDEFQAFKATATPSTDLIMAYLRALSESGIKVDGFWQSDVMLDMLMDSVVDRDVEREELDLQKEIRVWGKFLDENGKIDQTAYEYLNAKMEEYTGNLSLTRPAQINRYRDLCKAELRKIRLEEDPEATQKDISAATTEILTLMKLLKIDNFQSDSRTDVEKTLEYQMALMEKTKPCEDEDINKYRDFCGFYNLEQSLMRPLRNLIAGTKDYPSLTKGD